MFDISSSNSKLPSPSISSSEETSAKETLSNVDLDIMYQYLLGSRQRFKENIIIPRTVVPYQTKTNDQKMMEKAMESCTFKSMASCVIGCGVGCLFGLMGFFIYPNVAVAEKPQTVREVMKEMKITTLSSAKSFAIFSCMYSAIECTIESYKGKTDWKNSLYAGGLTGGILGLRAGVKAGLLGAAALATLSSIIEYFTH